jgi:zinc/manganese transport system substrate-binding protein
MLKSIRRALTLIVITLMSITASTAFAEPLKVVASFSIIGDFAKNVGGDRVAVTTLVGPDGDAHVYEPSPADAVSMASAKVVLVNGLHFEGFLQRLVEASASKAAIVELTKGVTPIEFKPEFAEAESTEGGNSHEGHDHGSTDPHAFQSVPNAKIYVKNIADAFCAADSAGCDSYKANAAAYTEKLEALDKEVREAINAIPRRLRLFRT